MRLSAYFLPTLKENPTEAQIVSHRYMLRAGMIRQATSGIYSWLPMGLKVLRKVEQIIREEQNRAGAQEILMPTIQPADLWRKSGRYDDYGKEMLRIEDRHGRDMLYGPTNEEMVTEIFANAVKSYKDLPKNLYHIQWKFRDEVRPRFGVMRGREFFMKDAYSFDIDFEASKAAYNRMFVSYLRTFERLGLRAIPMAADTGPIGGDLSHEFIILADTGESEVFCHSDFLEKASPSADVDYSGDLQPIVDDWTSIYAATDEMYVKEDFEGSVPEDKRMQCRGIEVGHIFHFGTKYSEPMGAYVLNSEGENVPVFMGSYGIGVSRLLGAIIEASHDENGIIWPEAVAPYQVGLINLKAKDEACAKACDDLYQKFNAAGVDCLYDDRDTSAGAKFKDMDLIGLPWQMVIGPRGLKNGVVELKNRKTGEKEELTLEAALSKLGL
ncbi:proline--tRNA ligase [Kiloniella majae]|uniref:proline--tRNA ligase n=1 Tax=Kiloniella majae TaxID=1938558 RepID=UPI000A2793FC|nr:proline--tRNA ligase [Kiloniella majae]